MDILLDMGFKKTDKYYILIEKLKNYMKERNVILHITFEQWLYCWTWIVPYCVILNPGAVIYNDKHKDRGDSSSTNISHTSIIMSFLNKTKEFITILDEDNLDINNFRNTGSKILCCTNYMKYKDKLIDSDLIGTSHGIDDDYLWVLLEKNDFNGIKDYFSTSSFKIFRGVGINCLENSNILRKLFIHNNGKEFIEKYIKKYNKNNKKNFLVCLDWEVTHLINVEFIKMLKHISKTHHIFISYHPCAHHNCQWYNDWLSNNKDLKMFNLSSNEITVINYHEIISCSYLFPYIDCIFTVWGSISISVLKYPSLAQIYFIWDENTNHNSTVGGEKNYATKLKENKHFFDDHDITNNLLYFSDAFEKVEKIQSNLLIEAFDKSITKKNDKARIDTRQRLYKLYRGNIDGYEEIKNIIFILQKHFPQCNDIIEYLRPYYNALPIINDTLIYFK